MIIFKLNSALILKLDSIEWWAKWRPVSILCIVLVGFSPSLCHSASTRFAVLDLADPQGLLSQSEISVLSDAVRAASRSTLPVDRYIVMTRENVVQLLPPGTSISSCVGDCAIDTGKNIGAQHILTGEFRSIEGKKRITVSLYDVASANLINSASVFGDNLSVLEGNLVESVISLLLYLPGAARDQMEIFSAAERLQRDIQKSRSRTNRFLHIGAGLALLGAGYFHLEADSAYDSHLEANSVSEAASSWEDYEGGIGKRNLAAGIAGGIILWRVLRHFQDVPTLEELREGLIQERRSFGSLNLGSADDIVLVSHKVRF